jgi:hypothetical protein
MLNSISPRRHLDELNARFGQIFSSQSPDFSFCYRTLDICESLIFHDKSVLVSYGHDRSNGNSFARGIMTRDRQDYVKNLGAIAINQSSPLPSFLTVGNAVVHEYYVCKQSSRSEKFPEVSYGAYMDMIASEVRQYADPKLAKDAVDRLRQHGWTARLRFRIARLKNVFTNKVLALRARKFNTIEAAVAHARNHTSADCAWLPYPARNYGLKLPLPPPWTDVDGEGV